MSDADFEQIRKLQEGRNAASAAKKGSRAFDPATQRGDSSTKAKLDEAWDTTFLSFMEEETGLPGGTGAVALDDQTCRLTGQWRAAIHHPIDGRRLRQLLHQSDYGDPSPQVSVA